MPWLRGIVKNLSRNEYRKRVTDHAIRNQLQSKGVQFEDRTPLMRCISREQSDTLWTILEQIPDLYREPLVLYYREGKSVAKVAELMDLTEDAVKQRLSRGRKLVKSEIESFVEDTLFETRPDNHFAAGIIAALPATGSKLTGSAAMTGGVTAVGAKWLLWTIAGPLIGVAGAYIGCRASLNAATSEPEKKFLKKMIAWATALVVTFLLVVLSIPFLVPSLATHVWFWIALGLLYVGCLGIGIAWTNRRLVKIKRMHGTPDERSGAPRLPPTAVSTSALQWNAIGSVAGAMSVVPILAILAHDWIGLALYLVLLAGLVS
ncbi:MAG: sigma-70 family RNA polymerase sigma factor [Mariniblastus sp.]|nr:sigma-70 family RNA polymerase sigma factor [Mariniblastus sp.]